MDNFIDEIRELKRRIEELEKRNAPDTSIPDPLSVSTLKTDNIQEKTNGAGVNVNNILKVNNIIEKTSGNSVIIGGQCGGRHLIINDINQARWGLATGDYNLSFQNDFGGSWNTKAILTKDGYLGVNNTSPQHHLDVNGNSRLKDLIIYDTEYNSIFIRRHNARIPFRLYDGIRLIPSNANFRFLMDTTYNYTDLSFNNFSHTLYNNYLAGEFNYLYTYLYFNGSNAYSNLDSNVFNFNTSNGLSIIIVCRYLSLAQSWSRVFDFGNGSVSNNILLAHNGTGSRLEYHTFNGSSSTALGVDNFWDTNRIYIIGINHSAGTPGTTTYTEFLFASKHWQGDIGGGTYTANMYLPLGISRSNSFLGRSNWSDGYFYGGIMFFGVIDRNIGWGAMANLISWLRQVYF